MRTQCRYKMGNDERLYLLMNGGNKCDKQHNRSLNEAKGVLLSAYISVY